MKTTIKTTVTKLVVHQDSDSPIFGDSAIDVEIGDEGAGPFIKISSCVNDQGGAWINPEEWPTVVEAVERLLAEIKGGER